MRYDMRSETKVSDTDQLHTASAVSLDQDTGIAGKHWL